jgi:hypothetical protein
MHCGRDNYIVRNAPRREPIENAGTILIVSPVMPIGDICRNSVLISEAGGESDMNRIILYTIFAFAIIGFLARADDNKDQRTKSQFVIDLHEHIQWPSAGESGSDSSLSIFVIADPEFTLDLQRAAEERPAGRAGIKVEPKSINDDLTSCRILFLSTNDLLKLSEILKKVDGFPILTVTDEGGLARYGVMIEISEVNSKIVYTINKSVMRRAGLKADQEFTDEAQKTYGL